MYAGAVAVFLFYFYTRHDASIIIYASPLLALSQACLTCLPNRSKFFSSARVALLLDGTHVLSRACLPLVVDSAAGKPI